MPFGEDEKTTIIINKVKVAWSFINKIHDLIQGDKILHFCNQQGRFPAEKNENIACDIVKHARVLLPFDRQIWMMK